MWESLILAMTMIKQTCDLTLNVWQLAMAAEFADEQSCDGVDRLRNEGRIKIDRLSLTPRYDAWELPKIWGIDGWMDRWLFLGAFSRGRKRDVVWKRCLSGGGGCAARTYWHRRRRRHHHRES